MPTLATPPSPPPFLPRPESGFLVLAGGTLNTHNRPQIPGSLGTYLSSPLHSRYPWPQWLSLHPATLSPSPCRPGNTPIPAAGSILLSEPARPARQSAAGPASRPLPGLQPLAGPLLLSPGAGGAAAAGRVQAAARGAWTGSHGANAPGAHRARARTPPQPQPPSPPRVGPGGPAAPPWLRRCRRPAGGRPDSLSPAPGPLRPRPRPGMRLVARAGSEAAHPGRASAEEGGRGKGESCWRPFAPKHSIWRVLLEDGTLPALDRALTLGKSLAPAGAR